MRCAETRDVAARAWMDVDKDLAPGYAGPPANRAPRSVTARVYITPSGSQFTRPQCAAISESSCSLCVLYLACCAAVFVRCRWRLKLDALEKCMPFVPPLRPLAVPIKIAGQRQINLLVQAHDRCREQSRHNQRVNAVRTRRNLCTERSACSERLSEDQEDLLGASTLRPFRKRPFGCVQWGRTRSVGPLLALRIDERGLAHQVRKKVGALPMQRLVPLLQLEAKRRVL